MPPDSGEALLTARALVVGHRGAEPLLEPIDAELRPRRMVCLLGRNGAGKSTLLRTLGGLLPALGGEVRILGRGLAEHSRTALARHLAMVLPERPPVERLRARELVALGRHPYTPWTGRLRPADEAAVDRALRRAGAEALAGRSVETLSDGECQRVLIARALAQEGEVLLLDEPTAHLDLPGRIEVLRLLKRLAGEAGRERAVLLSTHDLELALRLADRIWLLDRGRLTEGLPEDLYLSGVLGEAFDLGPPGASPLDQELSPRRPRRGAVRLAGDELGVRWTGRALERAGFEAAAVGAGDSVPEVEVPEVEVSGPPYGWRLAAGGARERMASIELLLARLRELGS